MDVITELVARAASYIGIVQDGIRLNALERAAAANGVLPSTPLAPAATPNTAPGPQEIEQHLRRLVQRPELRMRVAELVQSTNGLGEIRYRLPQQELLPTFVSLAAGLWQFVQQYFDEALLQQALAPEASAAELAPLLQKLHRAQQLAETQAGQVPAAYLTPEQWRLLFRTVLVAVPARCLQLARTLNYVPLLVYQVLEFCRNATSEPEQTSRRRLYDEQLLREPDSTQQRLGVPVTEADWQHIGPLLTEGVAKLERALLIIDCPLPFELVLQRELREIEERRRCQGLRQPQELALGALACSGGGIRSATFNLGLLQGMASAGWLPQYDYLSVVSGGGYIGSWLAAWTKRAGSLEKVADRLCTTKSPVPQAEEVRPIRWLRMYSNYLAPNASVFSPDAWTIGMTWLRNTLLNQLVIVLALGAVLAFGAALLHFWYWLPLALSGNPATRFGLKATLGVLVLVGAVLASLGMRSYRTGYAWPAADRRWQRRLIAVFLLPWVSTSDPRRKSSWPSYQWRSADISAVVIGKLLFLTLVTALLLSSWLFDKPYPGFLHGFRQLWLLGTAGGVALLLVAVVGHYDRCFFVADGDWSGWSGKRLAVWFWLLTTSAAAAALGLAALVGVWKLLAMLHLRAFVFSAIEQVLFRHGWRLLPTVWNTAGFILGLPLVAEVLVLTVIARMALLGRNFPDERREWWGRMGAALHLALVVWLTVAAGALLARVAVASLLQHTLLGTAVGGGWLALVGKGVQIAFSSQTTAQADKPARSPWLDRLVLLAPYLFGLGLLMLVSAAVYWLLWRWPAALNWPAWLSGLQEGKNERKIFTLLPPDAFQRQELTLMCWALVLALGLALLALLLGWRVGVNEFSLHHFYRNRLTRAYLGASRLRTERQQTANPFTSFDRLDDVKLAALRRENPVETAASAASRPAGAPSQDATYTGPYLIVNATLNATKVSDLARQDRMGESFVFTPYYCGFDFARVRPIDPARPSYDFGYRPTEQFAYPDGPGLGTAMTISGAAANPNEGYHSSPATAFLLTLFNVRLGWWLGNPRSGHWRHADPGLGLLYLVSDLFGRSSTDDKFVNLSDGGHFDNMGLYELVRRRCRYIVLGDGEADPDFSCEGLANAIRRCRVDFGAEIDLDVTPITNRAARLSAAHYAVGKIHYPDGPAGYLLYLKTSLTGDEPTDVREYAQRNPSFPHQTTADQFFSEAQFESYRRLGIHIMEHVRRKCAGMHSLAECLEGLYQLQEAER